MRQSITKNIRKKIGSILLVLLFVNVGQAQVKNTSQVVSVYYPVADYGSQIAELEHTLDLKIINKTLEEALFTISSKANLEIAFNSKVFGGTHAKITIVQEKVSVADALIYVLDGTGYEAVMTEKGEIILLEVIKQEEEIFQEIVSGRVTDVGTGSTLPGVNIIVTGTTTGTSTDEDGNYELNVSSMQDTLIYSFIGYQSLEVPINGRSTIDVQLQPEEIIGDELVVVGYGQQQVRNLTGSVSSVSSDRLEEVTVANTTQLLQGQMPGVLTKHSTGLPGGDDVSFSVRGFGIPLVLVDGIEKDLNTIDPNSIESISVLKDASAAVYGSRAGNGVVLVTTKRGQQGRPQFDYRGTYSIQQFTNKPPIITDAGIYSEFWNEAELNRGLSPTYSEEDIQRYKNGESGYESYDWYEFAIKNWTPMQKHNLSVNGGNEGIAYYANLGFTDQSSVISSDDFFYNRYNIRSNVDANITEHLSAKLDFDFAYDFQKTVPQGNDSEVDVIMRALYNAQPMAPTHFPDTTLAPVNNFRGINDFIYAMMFEDVRGFNDIERNVLTGNAELNYRAPFIDGLSANAGISYHANKMREEEFRKLVYLYGRNPESGEYTLVKSFGATNKNYLEITDYESNWFKYQFNINYEQDLRSHSVEALLLGEYIDEDVNEIFSSAENLLSDELPYLNFADPTFSTVNQSITEVGRASVVGRLKYSYQDKYLLETTFRYDGSSIFPKKDRWGFFPSISAGWILSEENFIKNNFPTIYYLKLRASYSEMGYDRNAILYDYFTGYTIINPVYVVGTTPIRRLQSGSLPNTNMTWENMTIYNVGLDATLFTGGLEISVDGFYRKRSDILAVPLEGFPSTFGASLAQVNLNSSDDRGIELMLAHRGNIGELTYNISGNITYSRAKWIHFEEENYQTEAERRIFQNSRTWQNRSIGYVSDGLFRSQEEIDNHPIDQDQNGNSTLIPGDIKYLDLNGDGVITFEDQKVIGSGTDQPDLNFGLNISTNYKNFSLSVLFQGASQFAGNINAFARNPFTNGSTPFMVHWEERFHPEKNPDGILPSVTLDTRDNNDRFSDFWLKEIAYVRLENVKLGYSVPNTFLSQFGIRNLQTYISGNNLAVISNLGLYSGVFDPEASFNQEGYPAHRTTTFGINIGF